MTKEGFNGPAILVASVQGIRAFASRDGELFPVHQELQRAWKPGWNQARPCHVHSRRTLGFSELKPPVYPTPKCMCGFWAYFHTSGHELAIWGNKFTIGIVEGAGTVVVGTLGFRAERARIVALLHPRAFVYRAFRGLQWFYASVVAGLFLSFLTFNYTPALYGSLSLLVTWVVVRILIRSLGRSVATNKTIQLLKGNYPDIPMYSSIKKMLKNHPLSASDEFKEIV